MPDEAAGAISSARALLIYSERERAWDRKLAAMSPLDSAENNQLSDD